MPAKKANQKLIGNISSVETMGLVDGPGVRVVVFMQGCLLRCIYCHNPETWDTRENKTHYTPKQLVDEVLKYRTFISNGGGVTFSGGEPMLQKEFLKACLKLLKKAKIHTAIDTCGQIIGAKDVLNLTDLVLLDVKGLCDTEFSFMTGGTKNNFSEFVQECAETNTPIWLRYVVMPGINDSMHHMKNLAKLARSIPNVQKTELLPYHKLGEQKYKDLGINNPTLGIDALPEHRLKICQKYYNDAINELKQSNN